MQGCKAEREIPSLMLIWEEQPHLCFLQMLTPNHHIHWFPADQLLLSRSKICRDGRICLQRSPGLLWDVGTGLQVIPLEGWTFTLKTG